MTRLVVEFNEKSDDIMVEVDGVQHQFTTFTGKKEALGVFLSRLCRTEEEINREILCSREALGECEVQLSVLAPLKLLGMPCTDEAILGVLNQQKLLNNLIRENRNILEFSKLLPKQVPSNEEMVGV